MSVLLSRRVEQDGAVFTRVLCVSVPTCVAGCVDVCTCGAFMHSVRTCLLRVFAHPHCRLDLGGMQLQWPCLSQAVKPGTVFT